MEGLLRVRLFLMEALCQICLDKLCLFSCYCRQHTQVANLHNPSQLNIKRQLVS